MDRNCCIPETCLVVKARGATNGLILTIGVWGNNRIKIEREMAEKIDNLRNADYLITRVYYK